MINRKLIFRSLDGHCATTTFYWFYPQILIHSHSLDGATCVVSFSNRFAERRRLVAQPGGLNVGLICPVSSLVVFVSVTILWSASVVGLLCACSAITFELNDLL